MRVIRPFRVGRNCDAWCTRCRSVTEHTIIAVVGAIPKRVQCTACDGQHNYRSPGDEPSAPTRRTSKPAGRTRRSGANWQARVADKAKSGAESRNYEISEFFTEGDVLDHPTFGVGIVERVMPGAKIEVLFSTGTRLLAHNR